jgi:hypothetical protein
MEIGTAAQWVGAVFGVASFCLAYYAFRTAGAKEQSAKIAEVGGKVAGLDGRVTRVETAMAHLPDKEVTHRLELGMAAMKTDVSVIATQTETLAEGMARIHEFMLEQARSR